jgi:hypothetical protein
MKSCCQSVKLVMDVYCVLCTGRESMGGTVDLAESDCNCKSHPQTKTIPRLSQEACTKNKPAYNLQVLIESKTNVIKTTVRWPPDECFLLSLKWK